MNRAERRNAANVKRSKANNRVPPMPEVDITQLLTVSNAIKEGDAITIAGLKRLANGSWIKNCEPGQETVMRAVLPAAR